MHAPIVIEEAVARLLAAAPAAVRMESAPLSQALGRILADDMTSPIDLPPFNRSPLDGFAVNHQDIADASDESPVILRLVATLYAGDDNSCALERGQAARVLAGAELPSGATCVVRQEHAKEKGDLVEILLSAGEFENYVFRGEDILAGETVLARGIRLDSGGIGFLAGAGIAEVPVFAKPRLAVLTTGNELTELEAAGGNGLARGKIFNSNHYLLSARAAELGAVTSPAVMERDDPAALAATMARLLEGADILVTTGGVSNGERDCVAEAGRLLGAEELFHGVSMRPGAPALGLIYKDKPIVCLSGNPVAAFVTFALFVAPVLRRLAGCPEVMPVRAPGILTGNFPKKSRERRIKPARMVGRVVMLDEDSHSGKGIASLPGCNCLIDIPPGAGALKHGDRVEVILL